jgi:hypothetical protein
MYKNQANNLLKKTLVEFLAIENLIKSIMIFSSFNSKVHFLAIYSHNQKKI